MSKLSIIAGRMLAGTAMLFALHANADILLDESFSYNAGPLYGQGGWVHHSKNTNEPIHLTSPALTFPGYQENAAGLSAKLTGTDETTAHERLQKQFSDEGINSGSLYASLLINVQMCSTADVYFFTLCQRGAKNDNGIIDEKAGTEVARLFCCAAANTGKFILGLSKNGSAAQSQTDELNLNTTYLVVFKYSFNSGSNNDELSMWVNPTAECEPDTPDLRANSSQTDANSTMGLQAITLRQGSTGSKIGPEMLVDAIRVANSWSDLWNDSSLGAIQTVPTATDEQMVDVFNLQGMIVKRNTPLREATTTLPRGLYIINHQKIYVK